MKKASKGYEKSEILIVGDQLMTDIWGGNKFKIYSILVDPIDASTDKKVAKWINRRIEKSRLKKYIKKGWLVLDE